MRGPYRKRLVHSPPQVTHFRPVDVPPGDLDRERLSLDEYEAIRLADLLQLDHMESAKSMQISRPTFSRLVMKARHKVARMLIEGRELFITGGHCEFVHPLQRCQECGAPLEETDGGNIGCRECGFQRSGDSDTNEP